jgi:hypothetical protein
MRTFYYVGNFTGLYFTGQDVTLTGFGACVYSGWMCTSAILNKNYSLLHELYAQHKKLYGPPKTKSIDDLIFLVTLSSSTFLSDGPDGPVAPRKKLISFWTLRLLQWNHSILYDEPFLPSISFHIPLKWKNPQSTAERVRYLEEYKMKGGFW